MKKLFLRIMAVTLAAIITLTLTSSAQEAQPSTAPGLTVTVGDWTLKFTQLTADQSVIRTDPKGNQSTYSTDPGYKIVYMIMEVLPESKKQGWDDLDISLVKEDGSNMTAAMFDFYEDNVLIKLDYMTFSPISADESLDKITLSVAVEGQGEYTCPLSDVMDAINGSSAADMATGITALPMETPIDFELGRIALDGVNENALIMPTGMKEDERAIMVMITLDLKSDDAEPAYDKLQEAAYLMDEDGNQYRPGGAIRVKKDNETDALNHILLIAIPKEAVTFDMVFGFEDQQRTLTQPEE